MEMTLAREGTKEDHAKAQEIAQAMTDVLDNASVPHVMGGLSLFLIGSFLGCIKPEYRLAAFDQFAAHCRHQIERKSRS